MRKLIVRAVTALFFCSGLLAAAGCATTPRLPEGFDTQGWLVAVADGDLAAVKEGLDLGVPAQIQRADGFTAIQIAVRQGQFQVAQTLIAAGADVNKIGQKGLTPLFGAIYRDDAGMVKLLIDSGARPEGDNGYSMDPLALALARGDVQIITELASVVPSAGKRVQKWIGQQSATDAAGAVSEATGELLCLQGLLDLAGAEDLQSALSAEKILITAAQMDSIVAAYNLAQAYSNQDSLLFSLSKAQRLISDYYYSTSRTESAFFAKRAASGSEPLATFLYGRALRQTNSNGEKSRARGSELILQSAKAGNLFAQADLGEKYETYFPNAPADEIRREKLAWLEKAAGRDLAEAAYNLAYIYVHGHWAPRDLDKALFWFNRTGELGGCYVYQRIGYNFQQGNEGFPSDLQRAVEWYRKGAQCGDTDAMATLAKAYEEGTFGLLVNTFQAAKYYALSGGREKKVTELASKGLPEAVEDDGAGLVGQWLGILPQNSPAILAGWMSAARSNAPNLAKMFLEAGVDVNSSYREQTALMVAALYGHDEMITWLLKKGSDIDESGPFGTALTMAAGRGQLNVVRLLLEKGAEVEGGTGSPSPIAQAVRGGHHEVVRLLLVNGATSPGMNSAAGKELFALIRQKGDTEMERLLLEAPQASLSAQQRETELVQLAQREHNAQRKEQWLAGKLMVRRDGAGKELATQDGRYEATSWRCISDEMSGLSWLVKDDAGGLHDKDLSFAPPGTSSGTCHDDDCDVLAYRDRVRGEQPCAAADWRLPTVAELESLAYPHVAASFPHWPGFTLWARDGKEGELVLTHASGLFGQKTWAIAFGNTGQALLVRGRLKELPEKSDQDFTIIRFE